MPTWGYRPWHTFVEEGELILRWAELQRWRGMAVKVLVLVATDRGRLVFLDREKLEVYKVSHEPPGADGNIGTAG